MYKNLQTELLCI